MGSLPNLEMVLGRLVAMPLHATLLATVCCISHLLKNVYKEPRVFVVMCGIIPLLNAGEVAMQSVHLWGGVLLSRFGVLLSAVGWGVAE